MLFIKLCIQFLLLNSYHKIPILSKFFFKLKIWNEFGFTYRRSGWMNVKDNYLKKKTQNKFKNYLHSR